MYRLVLHSFYVFLGACSFGILSTIVKLAYKEGFSFREVTMGQYGFGWAIMLILMIIFSRQKISFKQFIRLAVVGACTALTGVFYYYSLQTIPASIAIILLFQFTWMGILIHSVATKKWPSRSTLLSIFLLMGGTFLAGGIVGGKVHHIDVMGLIFGLLAALMMTLFILLSGKVETKLPLITRSFYISTGGLLILLTVFTPKVVFTSLGEGLWFYGFILGAFGTVIPILLFSLGAPKISPELASILSAGELPVAVIASVWVLHEQVTWLQWFGVLIILAGIAYPQIRSYLLTKHLQKNVKVL
ncbi:EamA family transporter [Robertmurraya korlensis]|uniref:EamA family transporter n=1 Tax=Robertmurraya korlensis TaxID=519977 RepID=UPI0008247147|nr:DMT family transporter [Robertmurraya korlensis]